MAIVLDRRQLMRLALAAAPLGAVLPARACQFYTPNLRINHPWARETPEDATSAVLNMKFDEVVEDDRLIGLETPVAEAAELGGPGARPALDFEIPRGRETALGERGTFIRLVGLRQPLYVGRTYPMRLVFARGGSVAVDLNIDFGRFY